MSTAIDLFFSVRDEDPIYWIDRRGGAGVPASIGVAHDLSDLTSAGLGGQMVRLIIPGNDVLMRHEVLPPVGGRKLREALGFLLEDHLAVPSREHHFVAAARGEEGKALIAAIEVERLLSYLDRADQAGLQVATIEPDALALVDRDPEHAHILCLDDRVILIPVTDAPTTLPLDVAPYVLPGWCDEQAPHRIVAAGPDHFFESWGLSGRADLTQIPASTDMAAVLGAQIAPDRGRGKPLELASGAFAGVSQSVFEWQHLIRAGGLAAALLLIVIAGPVMEASAKLERADFLQEQTRSRFQQTFPDVKRVVNPQAQMRAALRQLSGTTGESFLRLSAMVMESIQDMPSVKVQRMRYDRDDEELELRLEADSFGRIEQLKAAISERSGRLEERGARQEGAVIVSNVVVRL